MSSVLIHAAPPAMMARKLEQAKRLLCGPLSGLRSSDLFHEFRPIRYGATAVCAALMLNAVPEAAAQSAAEKGLQIAKTARAADRGFGNYTAELSMVLRNRRGKESRRSLRIKVLEVAGDGNKTVFVFDNPKDVKGTAFLIHGHVSKSDDQWLYLPALKRVKRISSSKRSGSFMGSEFAYEDLTIPEVEKFTYKWLRNEPCGNLTCTVLEMIPTERGSGYSRQIAWHDTKEFRAWKTEYYDRKNDHLKTLTFSGYKEHAGGFWKPESLNMVNHATGKSTDLNWSNYQFNTNLSEKDFTQTSLRRIR
ncbi:MAG: outer membrane lipoprotein-sorting protein [Boseongicola sp.]|nr:outer membrane lipoprotein-sorting protein [Boseongicola sp.]MDE0345285.1 outer membrane lipoprotein-sorting protein [Boseongicola sp.]